MFAASKLLGTLKHLFKLSAEFASYHHHCLPSYSLPHCFSCLWTHSYFQNKKHNVQSISGASNNLSDKSQYRELFWGPQYWIHHSLWRQQLKCSGLLLGFLSFFWGLHQVKFILRVFRFYCKYHVCGDMSKFSHVRETTRWQALAPQFVCPETTNSSPRH
jgi:hypothetical protein